MAKQKPVITNAMRILNKEKISYELVEYDTGGEVGDNFGEHIADLCGIDPNMSFKTLVVQGKSVYVACIPVCCELDLKKLAACAGEKKLEMIHVKDLFALTGYIRGGVSPIGMKKNFRTFINSTVSDFDKVAVSGGRCGSTVLVSPNDLVKITSAVVADIIR